MGVYADVYMRMADNKLEMVRGRAVSNDSGAPREDHVDSPRDLLVPAVKYGLMQRMAALVEDSNDAIISVAGEATVASWNRAAECIFGYTEQEMIGQPIFRLACVGEEGAMGGGRPGAQGKTPGPL
jgi:PAS domain-containing protein